MDRRYLVRGFALATLILSTFLELPAQTVMLHDPVTTGASPAQIIADETANMVHVLTSGVDRNFNGVVESDSGDVAAHWYRLSRSGEVLDSLNFEAFFNSYPVRAAIDGEGRILYAPVDGVIRSFHLDEMTVIEDTLVDLRGAGVTWAHGLGTLAIAMRADDFSSPGEIVHYHPRYRMIAGRFPAGVNPADGISGIENEEFDLVRSYLINEGDASGNASLSMWGASEDIYRAVNDRRIGGGAVAAESDGSELFILLKGDSGVVVRVIDRLTHLELPDSKITISDTLQPLDIAVGPDHVAVLAFGGQLLVFDRTTRELVVEATVPGRGLSVAVGTDRFFVAGPEDEIGEASSRVFMVDLEGNVTNVSTGFEPSNVWSLGEMEILVVGNDDKGGNGWWSVIDLEGDSTLTSGVIPTPHINGERLAAYSHERNVLGVSNGVVLMEVDVRVDGAEADTVWSLENALVERLVVGDESWLMANYPGDFAPDLAWVYDVEFGTGEERGRSGVNIGIPVVPMPAISRIDGAAAFYALPWAPFSASGSALLYIEYHPKLFEGELGTFANHITRGEQEYCWEGSYTVVTMSGSHEVVYLHGLETVPEITSRTPTGTSGFDGPRASVLAPCAPAGWCGATLTSTYDGKLVLHYDGSVLDVADLTGRGEGLALLGDTAWAANVLQLGSFGEPEMVVTPATVTWPPGSVAASTLPEGSLRVVSTGDQLLVELELTTPGSVAMNLVDMSGRPVLSQEPTPAAEGTTTTEFTTTHLPSGVYLLTVESPDGVGVATLKVVR